jgi:GT2 family glycosyltransferase
MLQYAGFTRMNFVTGRNKRIGEFETDKGQYDRSGGETAYAHGAAMLVRREAVRKAGLMAEHFFLYYEELDWCERIRKSGYRIWFEPAALIFHKESVSVGGKSALKEFFMNRNRILFVRRHAAPASLVFFWIYFCLVVAPRNLLVYAREKRGDLARQFLRAIWWNITHGVNSNDLGYPLNTIK